MLKFMNIITFVAFVSFLLADLYTIALLLTPHVTMQELFSRLILAVVTLVVLFASATFSTHLSEKASAS